MKNHIIISLLFLSVGLSQNSQKMILNDDIQNYLFSTQSVLKEYIIIQDDIFSPLQDTLDIKNYKSLSYSLKSINNTLIGNKNTFSNSKDIKLDTKEKVLVNVLDKYNDKLSKTILQLKLICTKLNDLYSYPPNEYSKDMDTFQQLRDEYMNEGKFLNILLDDFLL